MKLHILAVGKPSLPYARDGVAEYTKRFRHGTNCTLHFIKPSRTESTELIARSSGFYRVALDERGDLLTTAALAERIAEWRMRGPSEIAFLIGGAQGHSAQLRQSCAWTWALSPLTLQHELALVVLLEQLYRALSILDGSPYHRNSIAS